MLHTDVDGQAYRRTLDQRRTLNRLHADLLVDVALDTGDALVVDVDRAQDVSGQRTARVGATKLATEVEAGQAQVVHPLRGLGG